MIYCRFKKLSTGYIQGSIPPQFDNANKKPVDMLGSDGVYTLDARKNVYNQVQDCLDRIDQLRDNSIISFEIIRANNYLDEGKIIYKHRNLF